MRVPSLGELFQHKNRIIGVALVILGAFPLSACQSKVEVTPQKIECNGDKVMLGQLENGRNHIPVPISINGASITIAEIYVDYNELNQSVEVTSVDPNPELGTNITTHEAGYGQKIVKMLDNAGILWAVATISPNGSVFIRSCHEYKPESSGENAWNLFPGLQLSEL